MSGKSLVQKTWANQRGTRIKIGSSWTSWSAPQQIVQGKNRATLAMMSKITNSHKRAPFLNMKTLAKDLSVGNRGKYHLQFLEEEAKIDMFTDDDNPEAILTLTRRLLVRIKPDGPI